MKPLCKSDKKNPSQFSSNSMTRCNENQCASKGEDKTPSVNFSNSSLLVGGLTEEYRTTLVLSNPILPAMIITLRPLLHSSFALSQSRFSSGQSGFTSTQYPPSFLSKHSQKLGAWGPSLIVNACGL